MKRYLVIAHVDGDLTPIKEFIADTARDDGQSTFHVIVPATPPQTGTWTWTEKEAYDVAKRRLDATLSALAGCSPNLSGDVVNYDSDAAVDESLQKATYDELVVGTPPDPAARTPFEDFERHVRQFSDIPIRRIIIKDAKPIERA
jgi:hypothetical protein